MSPKSAVHVGRLEMPAEDVVMLNLKVVWRQNCLLCF